MLTQTVKFFYLIFSVLAATFVGAISLVGGHGQFNTLTLLSISVLFSTVAIAIFYNKEGKIKSLISIAFLLIATISYIILILDFFEKNVSEKYTEFHIMKWTMLISFLLLIYLFVKKVQSHLSKSK